MHLSHHAEINGSRCSLRFLAVVDAAARELKSTRQSTRFAFCCSISSSYLAFYHDSAPATRSEIIPNGSLRIEQQGNGSGRRDPESIDLPESQERRIELSRRQSQRSGRQTIASPRQDEAKSGGSGRGGETQEKGRDGYEEGSRQEARCESASGQWEW